MKFSKLYIDDKLQNDFQLGQANTIWLRLRGLLGRNISSQFGLLISPCSSIHTMWMQYQIDAVFIDDTGQVTSIVENIRPWRLANCNKGTQVLELESGNSKKLNIIVGTKITWE